MKNRETKGIRVRSVEQTVSACFGRGRGPPSDVPAALDSSSFRWDNLERIIMEADFLPPKLASRAAGGPISPPMK